MLTQPLRTACVVLLVLPAALAAAPPAQARSGAAPVPVQVCNQSQDWRRPGPEDMARTVWRDGRYVDFLAGTVNARVVAYYTHHFLFLTTVSASGVGHTLNLTGLATSRAAPCGSSPDPALDEGREVVIWVLGYRVAAADVTGSTLTLTVEPNSPALDRGYAIVKAPRPGGLWYVRFVLPDGREVARASSPDAICCIDEPPPDAPLPAAFPRPANGLAVPDGAGSLQVETVAGHERVTQARYLALVRPGTAPVDLARRYAAALAGAGLEVTAVEPSGDAASFALRGGRGGPLADLNAGRVTVELPAESDPVGTLLVSLTLEYAADPPRSEAVPAQRLPRSGGTAPASAGLAALLGLTLLAVSRLVRR
jgi:hypothetical protein